MRSPCACCGSPEHSLLDVKILPRTRSGKKEFVYICPVAEHEDLDKISAHHRTDEINISFHFSTRKYAALIQYDERILMERFSELYDSISARWYGERESTRGHLDRIWNEILGLCQTHNQSVVMDNGTQV